MTLPHEEVLALPDEEAVEAWIAMCSDCRGIQERVLMGILQSARDSAYGREHGFGSVDSVEGFRRAVPISEYEDLAPYVDRMASGETDVLFSGPTDYFISTSGTTGKAKLIPENRTSLEAKNAVNKLRIAYQMAGLRAVLRDSPRAARALAAKGVDFGRADAKGLMSRFHYYSVTSAIPDRRTEGGIPVGFASGKTFEGSGFSDMLAYPSGLMGLADGEATMYLTMLFALMHDDVVLVISNNASRLHARIVYAMEHAEELIADMRAGTIADRLELTPEERRMAKGHMRPCPDRADELQTILDGGRERFIPRNYWPWLLSASFWLSGSVGANVDRVRPFLPEDTVYFDIGYGASEAKINVPREAGSGSGTLGILSVFYEFIPADGGEPLLADQLEEGREYELVLTNYAGLYRYRLHDIVRITGFTGRTPDIEFVTKSREILNLAQEKVPASGVLDCVEAAASEAGFAVRHVQVFEDAPSRSYTVYVEPEGDADGIDPASLASAVDGRLREAFELYGRNRALGSLDAPMVRIMRSGWQESLYEARESDGAPHSQIKLDIRIRTPPDGRWVLRRGGERNERDDAHRGLLPVREGARYGQGRVLVRRAGDGFRRLQRHRGVRGRRVRREHIREGGAGTVRGSSS